jgi:hypothetical protein
VPKSPILGTAYTARSKDLAFQRCVNLYLETVETQSGTAPGGLFGCPGFDLAAVLGTGPVRATAAIGDGFYAISGRGVYHADNGFNLTLLGTMDTMVGQAYIVANATQVAFFDAAGCKVWNGTMLNKVTLPYSGPVGVPAYQDGLCLLSQPGTFVIWQSAINDFTSWPALNFATEDGNAEPVVALAAFHDQIVVLKEFSTCFYANAGLNGFSYQRLDGVYPDRGCASPGSVVVLDDRLLFLGQTKVGGVKVYMFDGYVPVEVSTYAIENSIGSYPSTADAFGFGYSQTGHPFYVLNFPSGDATWCLDLKETGRMKVPVWHERASFAAGQFHMYALGTVVKFGQNLVAGDNRNGNLYLLNLNSNADYGATRKWLRSWPARGQAKYGTEKVNWLDIQMQTGSDTPAGTAPLLIFRQSLDNGGNWSAERFVSAGHTGQKAFPVHITRLGATGRTLNEERVFELSSIDNFRVELLGAEVG